MKCLIKLPTRSEQKVTFDTPSGPAYVRKKGREYVLMLEHVKERSRWGNKKEICADVAHLLEYGSLPPPARGGGW